MLEGALERTWSCLEVPVSSQPRQCQTSAAAGGIHTFPWPRAAVQHQWQQSRTKCQTLLQVSTKAALKIQIKPAQNQRQYGGDRPREAPAPTALCEHQSLGRASLSGLAAVFHLFGGALSPCGHKFILELHSHTQLPANPGIPEVSTPSRSQPPVPPHPALPAGTASRRG